VPLAPDVHARLVQDKRWGARAEPAGLDEPALGAAVGITSRKAFMWRSGGVDYFAVAIPLPKLGWTYVAVQPLEAIRALATHLRDSDFVAIGIGIVLATIASGLFTRRLVAPIRRLTAISERIVREGDLAQVIDVGTRDEVGQLATAMRALVAKLREIPGTLGGTTDALTRASAELLQAADEQNEMVMRQATALTETQTTAQELRQTALLAAKKAEQMLVVTERAAEVGASGEKAVEASMAALGEMRANVTHVAERAQELERSTRRIGEIAATVKDLADQSNMLALNAAIEAVRSGEHGRGFAVVAREIRSLADQSIEETRRVREVLDGVTLAIAGLVRIAEDGAPRMEAGLTQMKSSGQRLLELASIVKEGSNAARQIAAAVREQTAAIGQIFGAVSDQMKMMAETKERLAKTADAADALLNVSQKVAAIVRAYRA
jgi:methyl-accepting chemotaxis protein